MVANQVRTSVSTVDDGTVVCVVAKDIVCGGILHLLRNHVQIVGIQNTILDIWIAFGHLNVSWVHQLAVLHLLRIVILLVTTFSTAIRRCGALGVVNSSIVWVVLRRLQFDLFFVISI